MGVRGLTTFLERENHKKTINVSDEIRNNSNGSPIIVFDFVALTHFETEPKDNICGGRHEVILEHFDELMKKLKATGARLVFFSDLNPQKSNFDKWLKRRDESAASNVELYDMIRQKYSLHAIIENHKKNSNLSAVSFGLSMIARKYGELRYAVDYECGLEMIRFATENKAFAVVTNDSDALIFDGDFKFWSAKDFGIDKYDRNSIKTIQICRDGIYKSCGLVSMQRPLFATLIGNGYADDFDSELQQFHRKLGKPFARIKNVANYVKRVQGNNRLPDFERISKDVLGTNNSKWINLMKESIQSYDLNYPKKEVDTNAVSHLLSKTAYYRDYMSTSDPIQGFTLSFYDMRGNDGTQSLPGLFTEWIKRKMGVLKNQEMDESYTISILAKFTFEERFHATKVKPIYPEFPVPSAEELYLDDEISDINWDLLAFIMSLEDNVKVAIKSLPKEYRLICTILYAMVKNGFCTTNQADGILLSEYMVHKDEKTVKSTPHPISLIENNIRAAHVFNNSIGQVRENFAIAGLFPAISAVPHFDGVYFQYVMGLPAEKRADLVASCDSYRIYID